MLLITVYYHLVMTLSVYYLEFCLTLNSSWVWTLISQPYMDKLIIMSYLKQINYSIYVIV